MDIVITGTLAYDRIMDYPGRFRDQIMPDKVHILNVSFPLETFSEKFGGPAGNIAYNLKLLGVDSLVVAAAGKDFGRYKEHFDKLHISTENIKVFDHDFTSINNIINDLDANIISAFYPGAMANAHEISLPSLADYDNTLLVIGGSTKQEMIKRVIEAKQKKIKYYFAPAGQMRQLSTEELLYGVGGAHIATFNDYEWQLFQTKTGLNRSTLTNSGTTLIITRGQEGSAIYHGNDTHQIGIAHSRGINDTTGVGEAYIGGIAAAAAKGLDWPVAGEVAATIASYAVETYGAQDHKFTMAEFNERYRRSFGRQSPFDSLAPEQYPRLDLNF